jgi:hypothetical protein
MVMESKEYEISLTLDEVDFLEALLDDEEYRLENTYADLDETDYPHIAILRDKLFNARLHLKHQSI